MSGSDKTPRKQGRRPPWAPGQSGNPAGRPKGSRNRLSEGFLAAVCDDFDAHGVETIRLAREADPVAYVRMVAMLMPKVLKLDEPDPYAGMSDAELEARIRDLDRFIYEGRSPLLSLKPSSGDDGG